MGDMGTRDHRDTVGLGYTSSVHGEHGEDTGEMGSRDPGDTEIQGLGRPREHRDQGNTGSWDPKDVGIRDSQDTDQELAGDTRNGDIGVNSPLFPARCNPLLAAHPGGLSAASPKEQAAVGPTAFPQLSWRSSLHHGSMLQHHEAIGCIQNPRPVGHDQHGLGQPSAHPALCLGPENPYLHPIPSSSVLPSPT